MSIRRPALWLALAAACLAAPAWAQTGSAKTQTQLNTEVNSSYQDGCGGCITPFVMRQQQLDLIATLFNGSGGGGGPNAIDVYLAPGASNTTGQGNSASSPVPPANMAFMYCANGTTPALADPVCSAVNVAQNANTGSIWPAFSVAYGRRVGIVQAGVSGSTQSSACDSGSGNWQVTTAGSPFANALAAINAALTAFTAAGYSPTFRGLIINDLGGNDAIQIDAAACTAANYTAGYTTMAANFRSATIGGTTYPHLPIFASLVGTSLAVSDSGFYQVRAQQIANAQTDGNLLIAYTALSSFGQRSLLQAASAHPTQAGYNLWGYQMGGAISPFTFPNVPFAVINGSVTGAPPLPKGAGTVLQMLCPDTKQCGYELFAFGNTPVGLLRAAGGTNASPSGLTAGNYIGLYNAQAFGSTVWPSSNQGAIGFRATQDQTDTNHGTAADIFCTPNGTATPKVCGFFDQDGSLNLGLAGTYNAVIKWNGSTSGTITQQTQAASGTYNWNLPTSAGSSGQPLLSGGGGASPMTFGTLGTGGGGTGVTAGTQRLVTAAVNVNFGSAGDNSITTPLPSGFTRLCGLQFEISGASGNLTTATFGIFTASGGGGTAIVAAGTAPTVSTASDNTANNALFLSSVLANTGSYLPTANTIFFRVGTTVAQTANVQATYVPCP